MKKIIAIFSVILCLGAIVPNDGWGVSCPNTLGSDEGDADHDLVIGRPLNSDSPRYWCQSDDGCRKGTFVALVGTFHVNAEDDPSIDTGGLNYKDQRVCDSIGVNYLWRDPSDTGSFKNLSINWCPKGGQLDYPRADLVAIGSDGNVLRKGVCDSAKTGCAVEVTDAKCVTWLCKTGFTWDGDKCVSQTEQQDEQNCTNFGGTRWTGSECVCDSDNGLDQSSDKKTCICKTAGGYQWKRNPSDPKKCIDPGQACSESGGNWTGTDCDCSALAPEKTSDGTQCVDDSFFQPCKDSGGQWDGTVCKCEESKGLTTESGDKKCKCINDNEEYSSTSDRCVLTAQAVCENTGGEWDRSTEKCDCEADHDKHLTKKTGVTPDRCVCKNDDYDWKTGEPNREGCVLTDEARNRIQTYDDLKGMCEKWQGTWDPENYEDERNPNNWECTCPTANAGVKQSGKVNCQCDIDEGYMREVVNSKYICEQSTCGELKTLCESATDENNNSGVAERWPRDAVSDGDACYCKCKDSNKFYDKGQNKCIVAENPMVEICRLYGAIVGKNDNCVCEESGLPPEKGKICSPSTSNGNASSGTVATVTDTRDKEENIKTLYVQLTSISDGFKKSHWKTASGNFNGARLASDSIAGVVLGTVGGVVTSNVIKKNQVKGGFESLQCTVGGQFVADFADQFQVGIR